MSNKVSILMPIYNTAPSIAIEALVSLFNQSKLPNQIVIVDDGSTNPETNIFLEMVNKFYDIIDVVKLPENVGIARALNEGLKYCKHELIMRFDSDDIALRDMIKEQVEYMNANNDCNIRSVQIQCFGHSNWASSFPAIITRETAKTMGTHIANHPAIIFRKSWFILNIGGYVETDKGVPEDYPTWVNVLLNGDTIHHSSSILVHYRVYNRPPLHKEALNILAEYKIKL